MTLSFHLASGASKFKISKVEEDCNIGTKPQLAIPSDDDGYDDSLSSISDWSSLYDESDDDDDMSSFTTVSELSDFTWDLFEDELKIRLQDASILAKCQRMVISILQYRREV